MTQASTARCALRLQQMSLQFYDALKDAENTVAEKKAEESPHVGDEAVAVVDDVLLPEVVPCVLEA